jgi:Reverse transcriptase (RNA-dependent DNA polymerase)
MLLRANEHLSSSISEKLQQSVMALQYADDTAIISAANTNTLATLSLVLDIFFRVSGLTINYSKNNFVSFNLDEQQSQTATLITRFTLIELPIIYLGLPLTVSKSSKELYIPGLEKVKNRLEGWKGKLISKGGRE